MYTDSMTQSEASAHFRHRSLAELKVAKKLFETSDEDMLPAVLFHCHLAVELGLKSCFIEQRDAAPPYTHNLNELADQLREKWSSELREAFDALSSFCILARYGDEDWLEKEATKENAGAWCTKVDAFLSQLFL